MHACSKIKTIRRWCPVPWRQQLPQPGLSRTRRENDIPAASPSVHGAGAESSIQKEPPGGADGSTVDWLKMLVFWPITKSKGLKPAAAGQPSQDDESNNRGGGCSSSHTLLLLVGWVVYGTERMGWGKPSVSCLLARTSRSCPGSR